MQQSTILGGAIEKKSIVSESIPTYFLEVGMLGSSLRLIRKLYGETAKELANQLGITATYLSEIENGKKKVSLDLIQKYAIHYNIKCSTILFFDEQEGPSDKVSNNLRNAFLKFGNALERCENRLLEDTLHNE